MKLNNEELLGLSSSHTFFLFLDETAGCQKELFWNGMEWSSDFYF